MSCSGNLKRWFPQNLGRGQSRDHVGLKKENVSLFLCTHLTMSQYHDAK